MKPLYFVTFAVLVVVLLAVVSIAAERSVNIELTQVPGVGEGVDSRGDISGRINGLNRPQDYKVVIYVHTDQWYVQPLADTPYTDISTNGRWTNWTHLGRRYGVLVVRPEYKPAAKAQSLPSVGGHVIARKEVSAGKVKKGR
jgi:hypothetical protein